MRAPLAGRPRRDTVVARGPVDPGTVRAAVALAVRAPSVHNSQPWRCRARPGALDLYADPGRRLPATDPDGRDLLLSCGALLQHLEVALAGAGVETRVHRMPNPVEPEHLAALELRAGALSDRAVLRSTLLLRRRSDRRPYARRAVPEDVRRRLFAVAARHGVLLRVLDGPGGTAELHALLLDASAEQQDDPAYRQELALWSGRDADVDGIPAATLLEPTRAPWDHDRAFPPGTAGVPIGAAPDGATFAVLATSSDDPLSWLRAGEALGAVLLEATALGLAACPLSQPVEVTGTRLRLRDDLLEGRMSPQVLLRLGWAQTGAPLPPTPRRGVDEVLGADPPAGVG